MLLFLRLGITAFENRTSTRARIKVKVLAGLESLGKLHHYCSLKVYSLSPQIEQQEQSFVFLRWLWKFNRLYSHIEQHLQQLTQDLSFALIFACFQPMRPWEITFIYHVVSFRLELKVTSQEETLLRFHLCLINKVSIYRKKLRHLNKEPGCIHN